MYLTSLVASSAHFHFLCYPFFKSRYHTVLQYSSKGRTKDLYRIKNVFLSINLKFLLISPILCLPLEHISDMCFEKFRILSNLIPRSFSSVIIHVAVTRMSSYVIWIGVPYFCVGFDNCTER